MIIGLYDSEIKEDILSSEDRTLDETVKQVKAKESMKFARKTVGASNPVASVKPLGKTSKKKTADLVKISSFTLPPPPLLKE